MTDRIFEERDLRTTMVVTEDSARTQDETTPSDLESKTKKVLQNGLGNKILVVNDISELVIYFQV